MMFLAGAFTIVGCVATGAWLVVQGHPWFGFFAMAIGGCITMSHKKDGDEVG